MQPSIFDKIPKLLNWFVKFLANPLGIAVWSIILILAGGYYGEYQRNKAIEENKNNLKSDSIRIHQLEKKVYDLSDKLANRDCSNEVEKYMNLINTLQIQTSHNNKETQKRLEIEKQKTKELENLKQSLKNVQ